MAKGAAFAPAAGRRRRGLRDRAEDRLLFLFAFVADGGGCPDVLAGVVSRTPGSIRRNSFEVDCVKPTMKLLDTRPTLTKDFECIGYWWLPSSPDAAVAGTFRYTPGTGCTLELMGNVGGAEFDKAIARLHGTSAAGDQITLLQVIPRRHRLVQNGFPTIEHVCAIALVGNYHPPEDLQFSKAALRFEHLDQWVHAQHVTRDQRVEPRGLTFTVEAGDHGELSSKAGYKLRAEGGFSASTDSRSIHLDAFTSLVLEPDERRDLHWFIEEARAVRDLAAVCFGLPQPLLSVRLSGERRELVPGLSVIEEVFAIFWEQTPARTSHGSYPLIMFQRLRVIAPDILDRWKPVREKFRDIIDLILVVLAGHHTTPEVGFLLAMQAFEGFDRLAAPRRLVSIEDFEISRLAMVAAIPAEADPELRRKLSDSIKYANEPSLRQRLKAFHERLCREIHQDPLGLTRSSIGPLVDTRNFYTHYAEELRPNVLPAKRQDEETERFCALLVLSILNESGVPFNETLRGVDLHERFRRYGRSYREDSAKYPS